MATVVIKKFLDDLDGSEDGVATTPFAFEGVEYEIDLGNGNYVRLREFLEPYLRQARRVGGRSVPRRVVAPSAVSERATKANGNGAGAAETRSFLTGLAASTPQLVRQWYHAQDDEAQARIGPLSPTGSIPSRVLLAYQQAHGLAEPEPTGNGHGPAPVALAQFEAPQPAEEAAPAAPAAEPAREEVPASGETESAMIRAWYRNQPYRWRSEHPLKDKGRIPRDIREAWHADLAETEA